MKIISKTIKLLPVFLLVLGLSACSDDDNNDGPVAMTTTVVDIALANNLTSLAAALEATDLVTTLQGTGPFTVFAPDNAAFTALLNATGLDLDNLSTDEEALVRNILLNHVIIGDTIDASTLITAGSGYQSTAAIGPDNANLSLYFNVNNGAVELNGGMNADKGANVTDPDNEATNGTVHVINKVLLPPTIVDFALANPALSNLVAALQSADSQPGTDLIGTLSGDGPFTVFAPTDDAFGALLLELDPSGNTGLGDLDPATVEAVLLVHVVGDNVRSSELSSGPVPTLGGDITLDASTLTLTDSLDREIGIISTLVDIQGINGVVHVVDRVIRPAAAD
ncbi:fasciclin domain-containing protein [Ichthyenterobacterium sp. W332]|uniref:Fasciclin domain-containing protein n=1 Tax=Microcosmobacter mediterraneus TaxID=3075607 RepID=A0ABU2YHF3_9FLAO|nr:fasciclin domain-containing protein [Ichthyenterobacterium sp. W332]MDT0557129.1 fasciclin domain-containing protein [Ichthyenterobacterium sp. W332]